MTKILGLLSVMVMVVAFSGAPVLANCGTCGTDAKAEEKKQECKQCTKDADGKKVLCKQCEEHAKAAKEKEAKKTPEPAK